MPVSFHKIFNIPYYLSKDSTANSRAKFILSMRQIVLIFVYSPQYLLGTTDIETQTDKLKNFFKSSKASQNFKSWKKFGWFFFSIIYQIFLCETLFWSVSEVTTIWLWAQCFGSMLSNALANRFPQVNFRSGSFCLKSFLSSTHQIFYSSKLIYKKNWSGY